jgi:Asp-tRNA(Asn)/Glu-tRNA(Gln) amidotransferase C subunit
MPNPQVSKESLRALASLSGLEISDERLEELLPHILRLAESSAQLDRLDLEGVEPAVVFSPGGE